MRLSRGTLVGLGWLVILSPLAHAAPSAGSSDEFFEKQVRPLLLEKCLKCHGEEKVKGGLTLTTRAQVLQGGDTGPAAVPGKPEESLLIHAIRYQDSLKMPPKGKLSEREIAILTRWVQANLPWPDTTSPQKASNDSSFTADQRNFWSFQPLKKAVPPPVVNTAWLRSDIDRFILAKLEEKSLKPANAADKRMLLRRATFDLTGLPPTPDEIAAFLRDDSSDAFSRVVDRLLSAPQYGERWGRHWLDVVRYTDSFDNRFMGMDIDVTEAWRYRDWVVEAFNRDLPYDQFILHQIAGDLVSPEMHTRADNQNPLIATGMLVIGEWGTGDADKEKMLTDVVDDQVDVVSRTFMGLTVACARCHDHKFDPIPTRDYYGLAGIFFSSHILPGPGPKTNASPLLKIPLASPDVVNRRHQAEVHLRALETRVQTVSVQGQLLHGLGFLPASAEILASGLVRVALQPLVKQRDELRKTIPPPIPLALAIQENGVPDSPYAGIHDARVHIRGSYRRLGDVVPRHFPQILGGESFIPSLTGSGRLQLARWLANPRHPLTARVMVNRIWQHHFGEGIVRTPSNFGKLGEAPTHPELLDYLARLFIHSGWSIKKMHRAIMLSATYQQSCTPLPETLRQDPANYLLGRMNRRRLEGETIRDSLLAVGGRLDLKRGQPSTRDFFSPRRTLYQMTIRSDRSGFGPLFDSADPTAPVDKRTVSTVAPQALFLLNHPFVLQQARAMAERLRATSGPDELKINKAYVLLYGRPPTNEEVQVGRDFVAQSANTSTKTSWEEYCELLLCSNEFVYVD